MPAITAVGLSTADHALTLAALPAALDRFAAAGVGAVELSLSNFDVIGGCRIYADRLAELVRICRGHHFAYTVHGPIASGFTDPAHLALQKAACRACLEVSAAVGAEVQVHHAGLMAHTTEEQRRDLFAMERDALAEMGEVAAKLGVVIAVETLFGAVGCWTASGSQLARQIREVDHPNIRACIDFSHVFLNAAERGLDGVAEVEAIAPLARHLHVHDSFARPETFSAYSRAEAALFGLGDLHLPPPRGALPWERLAALPYGGPAIANLELVTRHDDQIDAAVAWTKEWIASMPG